MKDKGRVKLVVNATNLNLEEVVTKDDKEFKESELEQTSFVLILARDSDFAVSTPIEPMTNFQAAQKIQAKVRGKAARAPDAMAKRALKIRSEELLRLLQLQNKEVRTPF